MKDTVDGINEKGWERAMAKPIERYRPVVIGRYLGDYTGKHECWSIADSTMANRTNGEKFDTYAQAKARADELNKGN